MFANLVFINLGRYTVEALLATTLESDWLWLREHFTNTGGPDVVCVTE